VPTSTVRILAVAMTRTPQSPSLRRSPQHDKRKRRSESGVRRDERKGVPQRQRRRIAAMQRQPRTMQKELKRELTKTRTIRFLHLPMMRRMRIMMPRLQNHLGVITKRMIWKALTKVLPAAVRER